MATQINSSPTNSDASNVPAAPDRPQRMLTFASGGWVILLTLIMTTALTLWAILPAIAGFSQRPPGRKGDVPSFLFDLSNPTIDVSNLQALQAHRDLLQSMTDPGSMPGIDIARFNAAQRGKYVVPMDRVIGVSINGESRAYPLHVLEVHEIINDTLGQVPIAVTYNALSGAAVAFDRRAGGKAIEFGVSGLVLDSNLVMYERHDDPNREPGGESLWSQLRGRAISGESARQGLELQPISCAITLWKDWLQTHPQTTVVKRDESSLKRYKQFNYDQYLQSDEIVAGVSPMPPADSGPAPKTPMLIIGQGESARPFPLDALQARADVDGRVEVDFGDLTLNIATTADPVTAYVTSTYDAAGKAVDPPLTRYALWFAWFAANEQ